MHFLVHGHSSWFTLSLHLVMRGPKPFNNEFFCKYDCGNVTMEKAI